MLTVMSHQQLQELENEVEASMGLAYVRLDWMPEDEQPFEAKAFVLLKLKAMHKTLCLQHFHAPTLLDDGKTSTACPYCSYNTQYSLKFGVNI